MSQNNSPICKLKIRSIDNMGHIYITNISYRIIEGADIISNYMNIDGLTVFQLKDAKDVIRIEVNDPYFTKDTFNINMTTCDTTIKIFLHSSATYLMNVGIASYHVPLIDRGSYVHPEVKKRLELKRSQETMAAYLQTCKQKDSLMQERFGGQIPVDSLWAYMTASLVYPNEAIRLEQEGEAITGFSIDEDGNVSNIKFFSMVSPLLETEVKRILYSAPAIQTHRGKNKLFFVIIRFSL